MRNLTTSLVLAATCAGMLAPSAVTQQQIPLPTSSWGTTSLTAQGFWFELPANGTAFEITGLRQITNNPVNPTYSASTPQWGVVKRFTSTPPSGPGTLLFSAANRPGNAIMPCNVVVQPGDVIAVLTEVYYCGLPCGNGFSVGSLTPYATTALGNPITLTGCAGSASLQSGPGVSVTAGMMSRIEVYIQAHCPSPAAVQPYGTGCHGLAHSSAAPVIGNTISLMTTGLPPGTVLGATIMSLTQYNPGIDLTPFGLTGCFQYTDTTSVYLWPPQYNTYGLTQFSIPNNPAFYGLPFYTQGAAFAPGTGINPMDAVTSNGLAFIVGC